MSTENRRKAKKDRRLGPEDRRQVPRIPRATDERRKGPLPLGRDRRWAPRRTLDGAPRKNSLGYLID